MDMIRQEYETDMFVYTDAANPIRVRWYRAAPDAQPIRPSTIFGAAARSSLKEVPLGEGWDLSRYIRGSWGNYGGWLGQNTCGPPGAFQRGFSILTPPSSCVCVREMIIPVREVPVGLIDGMNRDFTLRQTPMSNASVVAIINGVVQTEGVDYSLTGRALRFTGGAQPRPGLNSTFTVYYWVFT